MTMLLHASTVAVGGQAVLLTGPPGIGKSDLALRLIDGGASLIADDQTLLEVQSGLLTASPPTAIQGMIEVRHIGLLSMPFVRNVPVALMIQLVKASEALDRLPDDDFVFFLDQSVRRLRLDSFASSTPAKVRASLTFLPVP